jgi:hypothetical protein
MNLISPNVEKGMHFEMEPEGSLSDNYSDLVN